MTTTADNRTPYARITDALQRTSMIAERAGRADSTPRENAAAEAQARINRLFSAATEEGRAVNEDDAIEAEKILADLTQPDWNDPKFVRIRDERAALSWRMQDLYEQYMDCQSRPYSSQRHDLMVTWNIANRAYESLTVRLADAALRCKLTPAAAGISCGELAAAATRAGKDGSALLAAEAARIAACDNFTKVSLGTDEAARAEASALCSEANAALLAAIESVLAA